MNFCTPGCLGTCWYGKYHYLEPFTGCEHDCIYCYAKCRSAVSNILTHGWKNPEIGLSQEEALKKIKDEIDADKKIQIIKLSRYTDIFTKKFTDNGYSYKVLKLLVDLPQIKRIIITTKGHPNEYIANLIEENPKKFSYNAAIKPEADIVMEGNIPSRIQRLKYAKRFNEKGVLTTIHMDPVIVGIDDSEEQIEAFANELKLSGLKRIMFSFLLYNDIIANNIIKQFGKNLFKKIKTNYNHEFRQILPNQTETSYYSLKAAVKEASVEKISRILKKHDLNFVICGLKSAEKEDILKIKNLCNVCDGKFYA